MWALPGLSQAYQLTAIVQNSTLETEREAPSSYFLEALQHPLLTKRKIETPVKGETVLDTNSRITKHSKDWI